MSKDSKLPSSETDSVSIISPDLFYYRRNCIFKIGFVNIHLTGEGVTRFPCIGLYDKETGILLSCPGFERWYLRVNRDDGCSSETYRAKANHICSFLNFLLWKTDIDVLNDVTLNTLRDFLSDFRTTDDDEPRNPDYWNRTKSAVFDFLLVYREFNDHLPFWYETADLISTKVSRGQGSMRKSAFVSYKYNNLGVSPPRKSTKKNRYLLESYLDIILFECRKHDPMILLMIALQSYAGLRKGEVVNLTRSSIKQIYGGFGLLSNIKIDLTDEAKFAKEYTGKTSFGSIKIYRTQEVYTDFLSTVQSLISEHESYLDSLGASTDPDAPLFINEHGAPLSAPAYTARVRKLFYSYFLPAVERLCRSDSTWAEHAPYIEAYEEDFPGCHMFRHWFTMYLIKHVKITPNQDIVDIVMKWRGDSSRDSMIDYIHVNGEMIDLYRSTVHMFQRSLMEAVL